LEKKIAQAVAYIKYNQEDLKSTISVRFSQVTESDTVESWLKKSERSVYTAKGLGRNNIKFVE
jgi:hypothetical protein